MVDCGLLPSHATIHRQLTLGATIFREGHDQLGAQVVFQRDGAPASSAQVVLMQPGPAGTDRYTAAVIPDQIGLWTWRIEAWSDPLATWRHAIQAKIAAGQTAAAVANDLEVGARLWAKLGRRRQWPRPRRARAAAAALRDTSLSLGQRVTPALEPELWQLARDFPLRELVTKSATYQVWVDRELAEFGSWYEFFPRSAGSRIARDGSPLRHGTFADAAAELPRIAALGFDVVYLPPIHPIGRINRKGRNNTVVAQPDDVGSPWAIGSDDGGHDAVEPALGTVDDFLEFVYTARSLQLHVALDLALQCAPDHPWVTQHPEWFTTLPDGSIAFAENPPKKYEDIYPLNFDNDPQGLYDEILRVVLLWIDRGVTIFRVDNPHTKPVNFWQWLIRTIRQSHPEVIFLAEAFTRPAMMHTLAKIGFTQSYTYFTWRTGKQELTDYAQELVSARHYMRPNFFVNTPDILHASLVHGGQPMFAIRAVLAATLSPTWGMYSGFELFENRPLHPGSEEYYDSEKYQLRPRDFSAARRRGNSLEEFIGLLNSIRRTHPALQQLAGLQFHDIDNDDLLCFSRHDPLTGDRIIVMVALATQGEIWGNVRFDMPMLGRDWDDEFTVTDLLDGAEYVFHEHTTIRLALPSQVAHILYLPPPASRSGTVDHSAHRAPPAHREAS